MDKRVTGSIKVSSCFTSPKVEQQFGNCSAVYRLTWTSRLSRSPTASLKCSLLRKIASFALPTRPDGTDLHQEDA